MKNSLPKICFQFLGSLLLFMLMTSGVGAKYEPKWESLDKRPIPAWYDEAKLGIFIHWGVFSVPSYMSEWFWWKWQGQPNPKVVEFMKKNYRPDFTYADFGPMFTAELFDAMEWVKLFQKSGAKYIVFTSKHHEGFTNWPSKYSFSWNSQDVGPHRDIIGELSTAIRNSSNIHFGLYHSLFEWFNPLWLQDKANKFMTREFAARKSMPELYELILKYKPDIIWSDEASGAPDTYWQSPEFLAWLFNDSPVKDKIVTNDRWCEGCSCHHGGFYTCHDRYNPGYLIPHKWENALTIDGRSWGFRRDANIEQILTIEELLKQLITTVSCNGNMLMNVGPTHFGKIAPIFQERLIQMGSWLEVNGEAIYGSRPWTYQNDTVTGTVWYTQHNSTKPRVVYACLLDWPDDDTLNLGAPIPADNTEVTMVGYKGKPFPWKARQGHGMTVKFPAINFKAMPCQWAWVLKLTNIKN